MSEPIITKRCNTCNEIKPTCNFRKNRNKCKSCDSIYAAKYAQTEQGKKSRKQGYQKWQRSEKGKRVSAKHNKRWSSTERGREFNRKRALALYHKNKKINPQMIKARAAVSNAIQTKKLNRSSEYKCVICHSKQAQQYHHVDYDRPFLVFPLCRICHIYVHTL